MQPNATEFRLTPTRERAALLVAEDSKSDQQIADEVGIHKVTLERWKAQPVFSARVAEHRELWRRQLEAQGIADRRNRVQALNDRWGRMRQVIEERAADEEWAGVPGWKTGLLVREEKRMRGGMVVERFEVDTGLLRELRAHEEQAAKELGQWSEKKEITGKDGAPIAVTVYLPDNGRESGEGG